MTQKGTKNTLFMAGLALSLPIEMAAGPVIGYFAGVYLQGKFGMPHFIVFIFLMLGFAASIINTVMVVRMMIKMAGKTPE